MDKFVLAQFSDTHVCRSGELLNNGINSNRRLEKAIEYLLNHSIRPDAVIVTGDLVQEGFDEEYAQLKTFLDPVIKRFPVYLCLGNHDSHASFYRHFSEYPGIAGSQGLENWKKGRMTDLAVSYSVELFNSKLVVLDSLQNGSARGLLVGSQLKNISNLSKDIENQNNILAIHHPPISSGNATMDTICLENPETLEKLLNLFPTFSLILSGHIHRTIISRFAGCTVCICPSTAHLYPIDLTPTNTLPTREQPGYFLHRYLENKGWISQLISLEL